MTVRVQFFSYFKELAGVESATVTLPEETTLGELRRMLSAQFPRLAPMEKSTLMAVGLDYQTRDYLLKNGDEVSLFPPVQGG